jgi:branched-chain amino acid transport system ATP-binding protein/branched-chain amino acid transport system permease protein
VLARPRLLVIIVLGVLLIAAALTPMLGGIYAVKFATRVLVLAIFVVSLDLLIGITGLVSFGHAMFFALGAYALYFISPESEGANALIAFPAAMLLAGLAALAIGSVAVLTRGFYFIMVTLAFGQMLFSLFFDTKIAGGSDGAYIYIKPVISLFGFELFDLEDRNTFYFVCLALLVAAYLGLLLLVRSPFGRVLQGIHWNEGRLSALGFNTYVYKLMSFVIAAAIAGLAGVLYATIDGFIAPELFGWRQSGIAIMMVVLGGAGTLFGPILGALSFSVLEEILKTEGFVGPIASYWSMALGFILIAAVLGAPRGIAGWLQGQRGDRESSSAPGLLAAPKREGGRGTGKLLETEGLSKVFGGLIAVQDVTLRFAPNQVHGIIGPNGAGKTTLINLLTGAMRSSSGRMRLDGEDMTAWSQHAIAQHGIARSYQRTNIILPFTARENCLIAAQAHHPQALRFSRRRYAAAEEAEAAYALNAVGLDARVDTVASHLSHGEQRQLEIAMLIASGAKLLILDEPLGGMGPEETGRVTALLRDLAANHTVLLVEHDMDAIFAVADTLTVLVEGRLLAHGTPQEIRRNPEVLKAYLGRFGETESAA